MLTSASRSASSAVRRRGLARVEMVNLLHDSRDQFADTSEMLWNESELNYTR